MRREWELLRLALEEAPARLSVAEAEARLSDPVDIEAALEGLIAADLLVRHGDTVGPTSAAIHYDELRRSAG